MRGNLLGLSVLAILVSGQLETRADVALPDSVRAEFGSYIGVWEGVLELEGEQSSVKWTAEWAPGKQCLVIHEEYLRGDEETKITVLMGYDRINKCVVNIGFRTDGGNRTLTYDDGFKTGKATGDSPDGKKWESSFNIKRSGAEWVFSFDGVAADAKDFVIRLRKKAP